MKKVRANYFANDNYKTLKIISDNLVRIKGDLIAPLTQQDIADIAQFSKVKTNQLLKDLIEKGFASTYQGQRAKYELTRKGEKIIEIMEGEIE